MKKLYFLTFIIFSLLSTYSSFAQFKVIGYYPTYAGGYPTSINNIDLAKVTHVNIAFANPDANGNLIPDYGTTGNISTVVTACHNKGVKVFMSLGGGGASGTNYHNLLSNSTNINNFVAKIVSFATTYNLDGIDIDIEGGILDGSIVTAAQYQSFVTTLGPALHAQNKLMSTALGTWFGNYVTNTAAQAYDWINMMSYDKCGSWSGPCQHSPYTMATDDYSYWLGKGVSSSKLIVGVPFYGYGWGTYANDGIGYCDIVNTYSGAENTDQIGSGSDVIYYNGIATIKQKANYALQNAGGIMIWELTQDCNTSDSRSLLLAINQVIVAATQNPTITFNNITKTYGNASFTVAATSNSSGAITYSITSGSQYASITSGGQVTILGAGTVTIQASQAAATGYNSGTATATLTINKANLTATAANKSKVYNTSNPALTISYTGFAYSDNASSLTTQPTASTTATTTSNVGTYSITLTGGSSSNYNINLVNGTLTITQATPTLTYTGGTSGIQGSTISLSATSSSTGALSYSVTNGTGSASVSGTTLNLTSAGTVTLTVNVAASTNYFAGSTQVTITINPPATQNPTITFTNITKTYGDGSFAVAATSNSPGAFTYTITSGSQYASITSGGQVTILAAGTVTIQANQAAATGYNSGIATATLTINKATLTATANNLTKVYNTANPTLTINYSGFAYSDNASSLTTQPTVSTTATKSSNVGTYPIAVTGGSSANYNITSANGTLTVTQATPTVTYVGATTGTQGGTISLTGTSNSTGTMSYGVTYGTGSASISGTSLYLNSVGTVTLTVSVAATTNYSAGSTQVTITINAPVGQDPAITFNDVTKTYGDFSFLMTATSNSSGTITYSIISGAQYGTITQNGYVTIYAAGTLTIQASQAAAPGFNAATATATLTINKANLTIIADDKSKGYNTPNPALTISYSGFVYNEHSSALISLPTVSTTATISSSAGTYPITVTGGSAANYNIILQNGTLTITELAPIITYTGATSGPEGGTISLSATSTSGGAITYSVANETGTATVSGSTLHLTSPGTVTLIIICGVTQNYSSGYIQQEISISGVSTAVTNAGYINATFNVYPNPINDFGKIELNLPEIINGELVLTDVNGKLLKVISEGVFDVNNEYVLSLNEFPQGVYLLKLSSDKGSCIKKIVK